MADGSINIDLLLNDQTDKTWSEFKSKAETAGKSGYDKFKDAFKGDPLVAKLETKANKAGIKNFRELLNQLPKEKQTELLTKAEKGEVINYEKLLREIPSKITSQVELNDNASTGLRSLKNQAEEVGDKFHRLKDIAIGTFVGSTISAGVRTVAGFISGLGQEALNSSDALQKFKSTMQLGGFGEDEIDKATKQVKKYADDTVYDLNTVSNTTAQLAANGVKDYLGLTEAAGNLNAQAGGNADTFKSVAMVLTQTAGAGKLTTENWNQMADAIPGASGVLQKALKENGAFTGNFRDAMADGQITADEFNDALTKLGSNDAAKKAATSTNTFEGAWGSLEANVVSGLDNMINKIGKKNLTGIINQLADVSTSAFGAMGKAVANVFGYINDHKKDITGILNSLKEISGALIGGAWDVAKDTITGIASAFGLISKDSKKAHNPLKTLNDVLGKIAEHKSLIKALGAAIATAFAIKKVSDFVGATKAVITNLKLATLAQKAFNLATKANPLGLVITALIALGVAFYELYKHNKKFKKFVDDCVDAAADFFKGIGKWFGQAWKAVSRFFSNVMNFVKKDWKEILLFIVNPFAGAFALIYKHNDKFRKAVDQLVKDVVNFVKGMGESISSIVSGIVKWWQDKWNWVSNFFTGIWKSISKTGSNAINGISGTISDVLGGIGNVWRGTWQGLSDFFGGIWRSIKGYASDGINGVLNVINAGVDAIDSVWKFFTGHETSIHHLQPVKFAQGGIVEQRLAMVNDGDGPDWKELIQLPNGEMKMSQKRNAVMPLPVGTRVYNGKETKAIMNYAGIEKYANGGVVGGAIDWARGALSNVGSWIGDKFDAIDSFLKNPLNAVMGLIQKATSGLIGGLGNFGQLASGTLNKLMSPISDWFTKGLKKVQEEGQGAPAGAGVQRWAEQVKSALSANGLSTSEAMVQKVLRQIQTESGGNERAVQGNIGDVNNASGDLAKGLMQVISATFNAFKFPGHNNPFNGYDSLLAGLNYAKNRYGSNLSFLGQGHGYANGGRTNGIGVVGEVQGEDEWVTNPNRSTADTNIIGSIKETAQKQPNSFAAKLAGVISGAKSGMQAITSQQSIIAGSSSMQSTNGGIDLSGDVHMTVQLDSGEIARATYPKIKVLQNQEIQMKGQVTGNTYVY